MNDKYDIIDYFEVIPKRLHEYWHVGGRRSHWDDVHAVELAPAPLDDVGQARLDLWQ